jgi:hypothetical protein
MHFNAASRCFRPICTAIVITVLAVLLAPVQQAEAAAILLFEDWNVGTSAAPGALAMLGLTGDTTTATSGAEFAALLSGSSWDLVIVGHQNTGAGAYASEVGAYIAGGGLAIGNSWTGSDISSSFEGTAADFNDTPLFTDAHPIFTGLPSEIDLFDPGWGTWARAYNPTGTAIGLGGLGSAYGVIWGNDGRTFLNGPLNDTYANLAEGELLLANEIAFLLPEPGTITLLGLGLLFIARARRRE